MISDFVLPTWFEEYWEKGEVKFDFQGHLNTPLSVAKGGRMNVWTPEYGKPQYESYVPKNAK